jgi:hypothetical protein
VSAVAPTRLEEAVTGGAIRSVNFFNGRLLTGDDLRREQEAERARLARLGQAAGEGIAYGLEVAEALSGSSAGRPVVTVEPGLALARSGLALELPARTDVSLLREHPPPGAEPGGLFADCQPFASGTYTAGAGVYLLTIGPTRTSEGLAAVSGLTNDPAPCNTALSVEAVKFRLIRLALPPSQLTDVAHLRNHVAHQFFGTDALAGFVADPFGPVLREYGLLDVLRNGLVTDDDVPLAVLSWTADAGIRWVDLWAVRRRLTRMRPLDDWAVFADDRRRSEGEAMFLQFQAELEELRLNAVSPPDVAAATHFGRLPPVGCIRADEGGTSIGFDAEAFFDGMTVRGPVYIEGAQLAPLVDDGFRARPIDVTSPQMIWLYKVRENRQPDLSGQVAGFPYLLFASGHVRYRGDARADLSYWDYANYARVG